ncbi:hypothetical protein FACS189483_07810 [Spirochaetia bacterium]|nr:hypothetical protein FACS189483_07810 [Spirochaetia bacterium]
MKRNGLAFLVIWMVVFFLPGSYVSAESGENQTHNPSIHRVAAIIIDPGHGGRDSGAIGVHEIEGNQIALVEKVIAYNVAKDLFNLLSDAYPDKIINLTRTDDRFISMQERVDPVYTVPLANNEIVLHISIHINASFNQDASGFEVWYLSPEYHGENNTVAKSILNMLLAKSLLDGLASSIGSEMTSRGIKTEEWFVSRSTPALTALVELGFLTNPHDALLFSEPEFIHTATLGLRNGIGSFITLIENQE